MSSTPVVFIDALGRDVFVARRRILENGSRVWRYGVYTRLAHRVNAKVGGIPLTERHGEAIALLKAHAKRLDWQVKAN